MQMGRVCPLLRRREDRYHQVLSWVVARVLTDHGTGAAGEARHAGVGELEVGDGDDGSHRRRRLVRLGVRLRVRDRVRVSKG